MLKLLAFAGSLSLAAVGWTGVVFTKHPGAADPLYFSGANSRAYYHVAITAPSIHWEQTQLWLNGEKVIDRTHQIMGLPPHYIYLYEDTLSVMFDSSKFNPYSQVVVKCRAKVGGTWYEDTYGGIDVLNAAKLYGRYDLEILPLAKDSGGNWVTNITGSEGIPAAESSLTSINYDIAVKETNIGWDMYTLAAGMFSCNVFYVHTHANSNFFWSDWNDYWYEYNGIKPVHAPETIYGESGSGAHFLDLIDYRIPANGTGLPPFNSSGSPPINLAFIAGCNAGTDNSFSTILYPYGNWYVGAPSSYPECQSLVGYSISFEIPQTTAVGEAFWGALEDGFTVNEARYEAFDAYAGSNKPGVATDFMHVWGDFYTRLKGVYTADASSQAPSIWYRSL